VLDTEDIGVPSEIEFNGTKYTVSTKLKQNETDVEVNFSIEDLKLPLREGIIERLRDKAVDVINHYIYYARTFNHYANDIVMVSPRSVSQIYLKIEDQNKIIFEDDMLFELHKPRYFVEYFDMLNEPGAFDAFEEILKSGESLLHINLLFDAFYALYEGRYNESILNCATATESMFIPIISAWLKKQLFHQRDNDVSRVLMETPTAIKYELLFGSVKGDLLSVHPSLLENLKEMNKTRNKIVHSGYQSNKSKAELFLNTVAKTLMILHFNMEPEEKPSL